MEIIKLSRNMTFRRRGVTSQPLCDKTKGILNSPSEGNFCDEYENVLKPAMVGHCSTHVGYVDRSGHMIATPLADKPGNWTKNCFSTSYTCQFWTFISPIFWVSKLYPNFRPALVRDIIEKAEICLNIRPPHRQDPLAALNWLDFTSNTENLPSEWRKQSVMYVFCIKQKDKDKMEISEMKCGVPAWGCLRHWIAYLKTVLPYTLVKLEHRCK